MCVEPCSTCTANTFNACTLCLDSSITAINGLCIQQPYMLIQIITTCLLVLFIIPPLIRKRSVTLIRIFDAIQLASYFKYINGYISYRHDYLYLGMRSWTKDWSEGWALYNDSSDITFPIWSNQQTSTNKIIRIGAFWGSIYVILILIGLIKTMSGDSQVQFTKFLSKNLSQATCIGLYINIQDMAFIISHIYFQVSKNFNFPSLYFIIQFSCAIVFTIIIVVFLVYSFATINFDYNKNLQGTAKKIYPHVYMFLFSLDYDLFPSYALTNLPKQAKKVNKYSNIRVIDIMKKATYSFIIVSFLYQSTESLSGQIYYLFGFILFFDILWYIGLPYDIKTQYLQFALSLLADLVVIGLLFLPLVVQNQLINLILCLSLFGLALLSVVLEFVLDLYQIIPVDLYQTGLSVIIEDKKLLKQIEQRKQLQLQNQRKMKQMQQKNRHLLQQLMAQKERKPSPQVQQKNDSQNSINNIDVQKNEDVKNNMIQQIAPYDGQEIQEKTSMNSQQLASLYRIDQQKRRKMYQYNKKSAFVYSNKLN